MRLFVIKGESYGYQNWTERVHYYCPSIHIVMAVTITGSPDVNEMTQAVRKAAAKHEIQQSRAYIDDNGEAFFAPAEDRVANTEDAWKDIIAEQELLPFHIEEGELVRYFLVRGFQTRLVIIAHHLVGDGTALLYYIRDIMEALEHPKAELELQPIRIFQPEDIPRQAKLNPIIRYMMNQLNRSWKKSRRIFSYEEYSSMCQAYWKERRTITLDHSIPGQELGQLLEVCRSHKVS